MATRLNLPEHMLDFDERKMAMTRVWVSLEIQSRDRGMDEGVKYPFRP